MVLLRAMTRSSVAVFLDKVAWSCFCLNDASALKVPLPRILVIFFSSFASCSLAISWGSFMRLRCTCLTRIGFSRRSPCKVVSDGLEKEGRKKDASNDRAAMFALLLCFVKAGLVKVLVVPQSSVIMAAVPRFDSVLGGPSDGCLSGCVLAGRAAGRERPALGQPGDAAGRFQLGRRIAARRRRGVPEDSGVLEHRETAGESGGARARLAVIDAPGLRYDVQFAPDGRQLVYGRSLKREPVASDNVGDEWPVAFVDAPLIDDDPY